jgi:outer membrane protein OmpA-like peptidoglycan-associated protein
MSRIMRDQKYPATRSATSFMPPPQGELLCKNWTSVELARRHPGMSPLASDGLRSSGQSLSPTLLKIMEMRFGRDFSHVRVHTDGAAADSARAVSALAYTVGRYVVFGAGQFAPHTAGGQKLLAHELAHVAQPKTADARGVSRPGDAAEREADQVADKLEKGESVRPGVASGAALQRQPLPGTTDIRSGDTLIENASPFLAAALGSATLDHFDTGKADLTTEHKTQLTMAAHAIQVLLRKYGLSTVTVIGHADTVGAEANNLVLGQQRAEVVKQALTELGVPDSIISTESKGEGAPQAVKTKDEVSSALNRRVEIRFHPRGSKLQLGTPQLKFPSTGDKPGDEFSPVKKPPIDINYHPKDVPQDPTKLPPNIFKPIPPPPKGTGPKSPLDVIGEKILDPVIDAVAGALPKNLRDKIKAGARDAVKSGVAKGARAVAEAAGLKDSRGLDAIEKAAEAAIQEKGKSPP